MTLRDFLLFTLVCLIWAYHTVLVKIVVSGMEIPPFFYAALRFGLLGLVLVAFLAPIPKQFGLFITACLLTSGPGFALYFYGMRDATPSTAAIIGQLNVPITTILSVFLLGEVIRWRRALGIVLSIAGTVLLLWNPEQMQISHGLWYIAISAAMGAVGVVLFKQIQGVTPLQFQAWGGVVSFFPLIALSFSVESGQVETSLRAGWWFAAIVVYSAVAVSVFGHGVFYRLLQRYDAGLMAPLQLMNPLFTVILGIWITGDAFDARMAIGSVLTLLGVLIIVMRPNSVLPAARMFLDRFR
jgi:O-acetylserine/cysteine efflux transporter